ncbi:hypothetical protein ACE103_10275 [Bradyrhizobium sp. ma5]|uniref:hypothetical protein n=1 Tax=Bradyrhizobium sp. ma5 TaxID=3344828 RepID=UPI0035D44434
MLKNLQLTLEGDQKQVNVAMLSKQRIDDHCRAPWRNNRILDAILPLVLDRRVSVSFTRSNSNLSALFGAQK